MALIRKRELKAMSNEELKKRLSELRLELAKEKAAAYSGVAKNPGRIREIRRTIARILTLLRQRGVR